MCNKIINLKPNIKCFKLENSMCNLTKNIKYWNVTDPYRNINKR